MSAPQHACSHGASSTNAGRTVAVSPRTERKHKKSAKRNKYVPTNAVHSQDKDIIDRSPISNML